MGQPGRGPGKDTVTFAYSVRRVPLSLQPPVNSSIRNVIPAQVAELLEIDDQIEVKLLVGQSELWARITPWARDELMIKPDM